MHCIAWLAGCLEAQLCPLQLHLLPTHPPTLYMRGTPTANRCHGGGSHKWFLAESGPGHASQRRQHLQRQEDDQWPLLYLTVYYLVPAVQDAPRVSRLESRPPRRPPGLRDGNDQAPRRILNLDQSRQRPKPYSVHCGSPLLSCQLRRPQQGTAKRPDQSKTRTALQHDPPGDDAR